MAKQQINQLQEKDQIYAGGQIGSNNGVGYKDLNEVSNNGITKTNATTYTVVTGGTYFIHFQQLVSTIGAINLQIYTNGGEKARAWQEGSQMNDMVTSWVGPVSAGQTIRLYQANAVSNSWSGVHSAYQIILLRSS